MASLDSICRDVRTRLGLPPTGAPVDPDWLLTMLDDLEPEPQPFCERDGLFGVKVRWNENAPPSTQRHQIARACCAHLLKGMRQLQHSPGRLAEMLCATSAADTQVEDIRRELYELRAMHAHAHARPTMIIESKGPSMRAAAVATTLVTTSAALELWLCAGAFERELEARRERHDVLLIRPRRRS